MAKDALRVVALGKEAQVVSRHLKVFEVRSCLCSDTQTEIHTRHACTMRVQSHRTGDNDMHAPGLWRLGLFHFLT